MFSRTISTICRNKSATALSFLGLGIFGSSSTSNGPDYIKNVREQESKIREAIAEAMDGDDYDGHGSYGPIFVRLAWHSSGSYDKASSTGGTTGACMRFKPESEFGGNRGLHVARERLEAIKKAFPCITFADLYTLASVVAIEEMGGPVIPWRPGRTDATEATRLATPDGRLPDASKDEVHIREIFNRMGFNDREMVALIGAHAVGSCHADNSGYIGPWTRSPTTFSNAFYTMLFEENWKLKPNAVGVMQYENVDGKDLMMLPADYALLTDPKFRAIAQEYAKDEELFFKDFSAAFSKLIELGVKF